MWNTIKTMRSGAFLGWLLVAFIGVCLVTALVNPRNTSAPATVTCSGYGTTVTCTTS